MWIGRKNLLFILEYFSSRFPSIYTSNMIEFRKIYFRFTTNKYFPLNLSSGMHASKNLPHLFSFLPKLWSGYESTLLMTHDAS